MRKYIGVKEINAKEMNRLDYNKFRGWELSADDTVVPWLASQTDILAEDWKIV